MSKEPETKKPLPVPSEIIGYIILSTLCIVVMNMDIYTPAMPYMKSIFETSEWVIQLSLMMNPIALCTVGFWYGHMADLYGRRPLLLFALIVFSIGSFLCSLSTSVQLFLLSRLIQCTGSCGMLIIVMIILADTFKGAVYAKYVSVFGIMFPAMFAIAPVIGSYLLTEIGWWANFSFLAMCGLLMIIVVFSWLPESSQKLKKSEYPSKFWNTVLNLYKNRFFLFMTLGHALTMTMSNLYVINSSSVFIEIFNFEPSQYSILQIIPIICNILGGLIYRLLIFKLSLHHLLLIGLFFLILFAVGGTLALFFRLENDPSIIIKLACTYNFGIPFCLVTCSTLAFGVQERNKGIVSALFFSLCNFLMCVIILIFGQFHSSITAAPLILSMIFLSILIVVISLKGLTYDN